MMLPPHSLDAETAVLACVLADGGDASITIATGICRPEHFYSESHRRIFEGIVDMAENKHPVDAKTLAIWLNARGRLEQVGGVSYLINLHTDGEPRNVRAYCASLIEAYRKRELTSVLNKLAASPNATYSEYLAATQHALSSVEQDDSKRVVTSFLDGTKAFMEDYRNPKASGIATGFHAYDHMTNGLHAGDLTIIAARPGIGKTSLATCMGINVARKGDGVMMFSMEMPTSQVISRAICSEARVNVSKVRAKSFDKDDWSAAVKVCAKNENMPFFVDDTSGIRVNEVANKVRAQQRTKPVNVVIIDYLQLMRSASKSQSREQEISEISRGLKGMAKDLNVSVLALSQLNRSIETRDDKKPRLSDLRESGAIEQDADNIAFIHREAQHGRTADIIIAKQRNGPTGLVSVRFESEYTRFCNLDGGEP